MIALLWFWAALLVAAGGGAAALQVLGPPAATVARAGPRSAAPAAVTASHARITPVAARTVAPPGKTAWPGPAIGGAARSDPAIPAPDAALLEPASGQPGVRLPRIAADGRAPMQVYAALPQPVRGKPRIALVVSGLGVAAADSTIAIDKLPPAVDLAFSPYAAAPGALLAAARARGHEILVSIPMESQRYPLNDPGPHALLAANTPPQNLAALDWALARIPGAVGATGALDGMRGERLAAAPAAFDAMQRELASRGLLYIDPRPGAPSPVQVAGRSVDTVLDDPADPAAIDAKFAGLERTARARGAALGLAGPLRPATLRHLIAWTTGIGARGFVLVPASALAAPPAAIAAR